MKSLSPRARWFLKLAFSLGLIVLLFGQVDFAVFGRALLDTRPLPFVAAVLGGFWVQWVTGAQMRIGLQPFGIHLSTMRLFQIGLISGFYSLVVPGGMVTGGAVTWLKLTKDSGQGLASAAMVVYLRAINTAMLVFLGTLGAWVDPAKVIPGLRGAFTVLSLLAFAGLLSVMIPAVGRWMRWIIVLASRRFSPGGSVRRIGLKLIRVLHCVYWIRGSRMAVLLAYSLLINLGFLMVWVFFAWAVRAPVSGFVVAWVAAIQGILQLVPVTVGGLGIREGSLAVLLEPYGMMTEHAFALSMTVFAAMVVGAIAGAFCETRDLWRRPSA